MKPERLRVMLKSAGRRKAVILRVFPIGIDGGDEEQLGQWDISEELTDAKRDDLCADVWSAAQNHCDVLGKDKQYRVRMTANPDGEEVKTWIMKQRPDPAAMVGDEAESDVDSPNGAGLVAMALRHSNEAVKMMLSSHAQTMKAMQLQLAEQNRELAAVRRREVDVFDLARTMAIQVSEGREDDRTSERIDRGIGLLCRYATAIGQEMGVIPKGFDPMSEDEPAELVGAAPRDARPAEAE